MSRRTQFWCDECRRDIGPPEYTWSGCKENGWRLFDFCSLKCAEKFRSELLAGKAKL